MLTVNINRDYARRGWATAGETGHPAVPANGPTARGRSDSDSECP